MICLSVMAGNFVTDKEAAILSERIQSLAQCDAEELRLSQQIKEPVEEASKGASLGLIEIARRASFLCLAR